MECFARKPAQFRNMAGLSPSFAAQPDLRMTGDGRSVSGIPPSGSMAQPPIQQRAGDQHKLALAIGKPPAIRPRQIGNAAPPRMAMERY